MGVNIIITGACGRMGTTLRRLLALDAACRVSGLVVLPEEAEALRLETGEAVFSSLDEALEAVEQPVIIDFTMPEASMSFARQSARRGAAQVIGTTGISAGQREELLELAAKTPLLWSPNMSIGINVLLSVLPELVRMLGPSYDLDVLEMHHRHKKDAPSGTALRLGEALAGARGHRLEEYARCHREGQTGERPQGEIGLQTLRGGDVVGRHTVYFLGPGERIEVSHEAHSRENFAQGAVRAAVWLSRQLPGPLYSIADMLRDQQTE